MGTAYHAHIMHVNGLIKEMGHEMTGRYRSLEGLPPRGEVHPSPSYHGTVLTVSGSYAWKQRTLRPPGSVISGMRRVQSRVDRGQYGRNGHRSSELGTEGASKEERRRFIIFSKCRIFNSEPIT